MRILALTSWWPEPADNGSRMRIAQLLRALSREHEVHVVALSQAPVSKAQQDQLELLCASAQHVPERAWTLNRADRIASLWHTEPASVRAMYNPEYEALVRAGAARVQPDIVVAFELGAARYASVVGGVPRVLEELELKYMRDEHTGLRHGLRRLHALLTWHKHQSYVKYLLQHFVGCSVVSQAELLLAQGLAPQGMQFAVIPNGADVEGCQAFEATPQPDTIIYPGALSFDANLDAMIYFLGEIWPIIRAACPKVRLQITGRSNPDQRAMLPPAEGVEFTGYVPDVRPLVANAYCEVVPLRKGGGTRLKILEALALGTPVVATSKGAEGLDLTPGEHLLVADTPADFAHATIRLLQLPDLRSRLALAGRRIVQEHYDWRMLGQQLNLFVGRVASAAQQTPRAGWLEHI